MEVKPVVPVQLLHRRYIAVIKPRQKASLSHEIAETHALIAMITPGLNPDTYQFTEGFHRFHTHFPELLDLAVKFNYPFVILFKRFNCYCDFTCPDV